MSTSRRQFIKTSASLPVALSIAPSLLAQASADGEEPTHASDISAHLHELNVVWSTPSGDSFGSMPLGNGDVGANVWVDNNGDVVFYISKVDAYDANHLLPKLGRVRLRFAPAPDLSNFRQTLALEEGAINIHTGGIDLKIWIDANNPVLRVTGASTAPVSITASFESLRPCSERLDSAPRLAWAYRNETSEWIKRVRVQNTPEFAARVHDPILHRTSGCRVSGIGFKRDGQSSLQCTATTSIDLSVRVLSSQADSLEQWFAALEEPLRSDWQAHRKWWQAFWQRSWIRVSSCGLSPVQLDQCRFTQYAQGSLAYAGHKQIPAAVNAFQISQRSALERFCQAVAGRGAVPPPYNGSIFTMDMPAGTKGFKGSMSKPVSPDARDWSYLSFMWQNTRHPYWSMPTRGDYDTMLTGMRFVREGLDVCRDRCLHLFQHRGAYIMEASWWNNVGIFNPDNVPRHLLYHFLATLETPAMMCVYYEHTRDRNFLNEILLPCADEFLRFYELHYPQRDSAGKMILAPAGTVETYHDVTNPNTEVTALRFVLTKLLSFEISSEQRAHWTKFLAAIPGVPTRTVRGMQLLAPGEQYAPGRELCESPELYSVYPFRQAWLGQPHRLAMARQSYHVRAISLDGSVDEQAVETGGWQAAPVQAAHLGLAREAARLASINFNDRFINWHDNLDPQAPWPNRARPRFPAFWECKMDGTPDNDHGANSVNVLQSMLLQSDGEKIYLLPAWPEDWDVEFKLHTNRNTTIECSYRDGRVQSLKVNPPARRADIVDFSTPAERIRTLVSVALADYNYLFDLPPMLDAQPSPGKSTAPWLAQFGHTLEGAKAGPWPNSVFRENRVFVHLLDWNGEAVRLPSIPRKLIAAKAITGTVEVASYDGGLVLSGHPAALDTIVQLEFDGPIEPIARTLPSAGSLTLGKERSITRSAADNRLVAHVALGGVKTFDRFEFTILNPGHLRGQARPFELQAMQTDGSWKPVYQGSVYGSICAKRIDPVTAETVRLVVDAPEIAQFDLFAEKRDRPPA